ncbi:redox-active disulfide protein 2 [Dissulfuribacter thermophilus]|uniref:Redox-active disulfide protein 2 n=1 Tax=Dissulfuribacter thermophilus TaxID=1156395 RepID=A0A1B9F5Y2_9BACT|nr:thioredoxin family protein [Dissulfuribacter thermophilus]OCC15283.1 redox-active disulfide protein 2 [Dissulfuribacter thermophilus]
MIPNTIVVNGRIIGIIGLEAAFSNLLAQKDTLSPKEAAQKLFDEIKVKNYIAADLKQEYLKGLEVAWRKFHGLEIEDDDKTVLDIKILGPGCLSCNRLEEMVTNVLEEIRIAADISHIKEHDEIWRYGVINTPALVINGKVVCSGRLPTAAQIKNWLNEAINS